MTNPARPLEGLQAVGPDPALVKLHAEAVAEILVGALSPEERKGVARLYGMIGFYGFLHLIVTDPIARARYCALIERCIRASEGCEDLVQRAGLAMQAYCRPKPKGGGE